MEEVPQQQQFRARTDLEDYLQRLLFASISATLTLELALDDFSAKLLPFLLHGHEDLQHFFINYCAGNRDMLANHAERACKVELARDFHYLASELIMTIFAYWVALKQGLYPLQHYANRCLRIIESALKPLQQ
jgi:hypothetical protein